MSEGVTEIKHNSPSETEKRFGCNVSIKAVFARHALKEDPTDVGTSSPLSPEGQNQAREFGQNWATAKDGLKAFTSGIDRAIETADLICEEQEKIGTKVFNPRITPNLGMMDNGEEEWSEEKEEFFSMWPKEVEANLPENYDELHGSEKKEAYEKAEDKFIDWWLSLGGERYRGKIPSPREVASRVAVLVDRYIKMSSRLYSGSEINLLNVTHKGTLEPFLKEVLLRKQVRNGQEEIVRGFDSLEEIGGGLRPAEPFLLDVETSSSGEKTVGMQFRGQAFEIDQQRLAELVNFARRKNG